MPLFGKIVVIKRNGTDGTHFPLTANSCLFGRKKDCDIRIQLPQVSKEHCKIELNENKEAVLFNLSSVNPTQLNGSSFQDSATLKHGDVLTIIDRSFRFEYPHLSYPQKRLPRSQEKETLQVLHIQQVEQEELLHPQDSEYKGPQISDKLEWESKSNGEKIKTPEHITGQYGTPKSTRKICKAERKNEMSPFSKLYELMKNEGGTKSAEEDVNNDTCIVQRRYSPRKDGQTKTTETVILKEMEHSGDIKNQVINISVSNPTSFEENSSRRSSSSLQSYATKQKQGNEVTNQLQNHDTEEKDKSEVINSSNDAVFRTNRRSAKHLPDTCCIVSLDPPDRARHPRRSVEQPIGPIADVEIKTFGSVGGSLPITKSIRENFHANSTPCYRSARRRSSKSRMLQVELDSWIEMTSAAESSAEIEKCSMHDNTGKYESDFLIENKCSKLKGNNTVLATEPTQTLAEMKNENCANCITKDGNSGIITNSLHGSNRKSTRRSINQNKDISDGSSFIEEILAEKTDSFGTGRRTSKQLSEENVGGNWPQEDKIKGPATKDHEQYVNMKNIPVPSNLPGSENESSGQMPAENEAVSEINVSSPFSVKRKSDVKKSPQKRKGTELDLLSQPPGKRKRVSFGGHLSPELFDKRLPPNSPLKRGAIPARLSLPFGNSPRAVLKKASGLRHSLVKEFSEREQRKSILPQTVAMPLAHHSLAAAAHRSPAASPPARKSPAASHLIRKSPAALPLARKSPAATPPASKSLAASPPARKSPAASPTARRSPACKSPAASPTAHKSPAAPPPVRRSPAASPPARKSLAASPPARKSPAASTPAHKSPAASPTARRSPACKSPAASPPACKSLAATPPAHKSPAASPPVRRSPAASPPARKSPASPPACKSPAASPPARKSPAASPPTHKSPAASTPAHKSPAASPPARKSPAASTPARKSPAASLPARKSPAASLPARKSLAASPPACKSLAASPLAHKSPAALTTACKAPAASTPAHKSPEVSQSRGRFSVSHVTSPSCSGEQDAIATQMHINKEPTIKTPEPIEQECKPSWSIRRSKQFAPRRSSLRRRSGAMDAIHSKRRSGASEANLLVAKSWAEVVKQGVPKSQLRTTKRGLKRSAKKVPAKPSKNNVSSLKTPTRKVKGHFTTGHANSPAPIVIGKAHTSIMNVSAQVPKVMFNYSLKQHCDLNESFTGMAEMFNTPLDGKQKSSLPSVQKTRMPTPDVISKILTPEESGMISTSPVDISTQQILYNQDIISPILKEVSQISTLEQDDLQMTPRGANTVLEEIVRQNSSLVTENETTVGVEQNKSPKQMLEPVTALSGIRRLVRTPKQKLEPIEAFSGVKRLLRTPKQKTESIKVLSGIKRVLRTPKQEPAPVEVLSGIKRLLRTPKQKPEPVEALSGIKRLLRTPKQKPEPVEALSGIKRLLRTPKQKPEPVEVLSGIKRLLRTPKQKPEPVEALSGVKTLLKTPKQKLESVVADTVCSKFLKSPKVLEELMGSDTQRKEKQRMEPMGDTDINTIKATKERVKLEEDIGGIQRRLRTPKQKFEPVEDMVGISRLLKTPKQKFMPVDDYLGLQRFMTEPKANYLSPEIDYTGIKEMLDTADEHNKDELPKFVNVEEDNESCMNSRNELEHMENVSENEEAKLEASLARKSPTLPRDNSKKDPKLEDSLEHIACYTFSELKTWAETIEMMSVPESYEQDGIEPQHGSEVDFVKEPATNPGAEDLEMLEPLASVRRTRRGKTDESSFTEEHDTKIMHKRNTHRTKSEQTNEKVDQNITEISLVQKNESHISAVEIEAKRSSRGKSGKHSDEINGNIQSDNIIHSQELLRSSKEISVKAQPYVSRRRVAAKRNGKAGTSLHLEENAATQENDSHLITKRSLRSRNGKDKDDLKSELTKIKSPDKMQKQDFETSGLKSFGKSILKRNKRGKATPTQREIEILNTAVNEYTYGSQESTASKTCEMETLENNPTEVKENAVKRGKGRKVHFLIEKNNPKSCEEKCVLGDKDEEERSAFAESSTFSTKENISRSKRKAASLASQPVCISHSKGKNTLEVSESISLSFEHQGKSLQEIKIEENPNETQKVILGSVQIPAEHCPPRRQKVAKENPLRRGRSKQVLSHETSTQHDSKQAAGAKDQNMVVTVKENQPKRGRGKSIAPVFQIPLENFALAKEEPTTGCFSSAQGKCLQQVQNEENPNETQKVLLESVQLPPEPSSPSRKKVAKENPPRRGRNKRVMSQETSAEYDSKLADGIKYQNMLVTIKENQPKRGRGKSIVPAFQIHMPLESIAVAKEEPTMDSFSSAQGKCSLQQVQNEDNPNETPTVPLETVQTTAEQNPPKRQKVAKENPPRRSRSKQVIAQETSTENDSKQSASVKTQSMVVTVKENQPKRGRGKSIAPVLQIPMPLESTVLAKEPTTDSFSSAQGKCSLQQVQNEENPNETPAVPLETVQTTAEQSPPKKQKVAKENPPRRGRSKQVIAQETSIKSENKNAIDIKCQNMVFKISSSEGENQLKRGIGRKISPLSQTLTLPLQNNISSLLPSTKGRSEAEQPNKALETATTAKENLSRRGRRRKTDDIIATSSVSASKKPRLLDNGNQEKNPKDVQDTTQENVSKRGRRKQLIPYKNSLESNFQLENDSRKATPIKDNTMSLGNGFGKENNSKRKRGEKIVLVSEVTPCLKVSITLPPSHSEKGELVSENQSALIENEAIEKERLAKCVRRNNKIVPTTSVRKYKLPEEEVFLGKQNVALEKIAVANEKQCRRGRRKIDAVEATISASLKEKNGLAISSAIAPKDQLMIVDNNVSNKKDASKSRGQKLYKGKNLLKTTDQSITSNNDQSSYLEHPNLLEQKNSSKRGRRKQVNSDSEMNATTCDLPKSFPENKSTKTKAENTESTTLQKGKRKKMKEENTTAMMKPAAKTEGKTRASRRNRK